METAFAFTLFTQFSLDWQVVQGLVQRSFSARGDSDLALLSHTSCSRRWTSSPCQKCTGRARVSWAGMPRFGPCAQSCRRSA